MNDYIGALLYIVCLFVVVPLALFSDWGVIGRKQKIPRELPKEVTDMLKIINKEQQ